MITMTHPTYSAVTRDQAIVRALNSITLVQAGIITAIARTSGQDWDVQAVDDYDGYRSILIETTIDGDKQKPFSSRVPHNASNCSKRTMIVWL